ncbi:hypothetical protein SRABI98_00973 [Microbacterium sp. Bi98]|uniref:hypothetical protein n=1 Tax=Microbacterium sp. Bi98 TaxID=2821116 RepID=UPI001D471CA4|nr:hypothetical protein [Microbacterium sp. Bi98]CAH0158924.1 hypothetical protein SRABI98_00973 [Microbacterium sp. Bi98]
MDDIPWGQILAVGIPALVSVISAVWATRSARRAQTAEHEAQRLRALEDRVAQKKYDLYLPFLQTLGDLLTPSRKAEAEPKLESAMADFQTMVTAWGSDDVVEAFYRYRVSSSANPPPMVTIRLMSDLLLEIRRDIASPDTKLDGMHMIAMRINGISEELTRALKVPLEQLFREQEWTPPFELRSVTGSR